MSSRDSVRQVVSTVEGYREETIGARYVIKGHGEKVRINSKVRKYINLMPDDPTGYNFLGPSGRTTPYLYWLATAKRLDVFKDYPNLWMHTWGTTLDSLIDGMKKCWGITDEMLSSESIVLSAMPPDLSEFPWLNEAIELRTPADHYALLNRLVDFAQKFEEYLEMLTFDAKKQLKK